MKNSLKIKRMVGISCLTALVVVLQLIANYITLPGGVSITLALAPIVIGAILYGPLAGCFLGFVMGILVTVAPSTISLFMPVNTAATIIICLVKSAVAGLVSGYVFKALYKFNFVVAVILAAIVVPLVNTGLFCLGAIIFFRSILINFAPAGQNIYVFLIVGFVGINFVIELVVNSVLSPAFTYVIRVLAKNRSLGFSNDLENVIEG